MEICPIPPLLSYCKRCNILLRTRAYGAIAPEPLGCASHSYLLTEESVTDKRTNKRTNERTHIANYYYHKLNT